MLPKRYKLPLGSYQPKTPKVLRYPHCMVKITENGLSYSRFGVVVGTRVYPRAVDRNHIKRSIFSSIRLENLHLIPGFDIAIIILRAVDNLGSKDGFSQVLRDLKKSL